MVLVSITPGAEDQMQDDGRALAVGEGSHSPSLFPRILRSDFDDEYRSKGKMTWVCPAGHRNCVLPTDDEVSGWNWDLQRAPCCAIGWGVEAERLKLRTSTPPPAPPPTHTTHAQPTQIREANRNILYHPEHYTPSDAYDHCPLRRYRVCPGCVQGGSLMMAAHGDGCKQWPGGGGNKHAHTFCFHCTRTWGSGQGRCRHGAAGCDDPGIQQVRKRADGQGLEMGHVDGRRYIQWLTRPNEYDPPPTVWPDGTTADGWARQAELGLMDVRSLLEEVRQGTA